MADSTRQQPINIFNENDPTIEVCCICLSEMNNLGENHQLDCGHIFHTNCIIAVFRNKSTCGEIGSCPLCRGKPKALVCHTDIDSVKLKLLKNYVKNNDKKSNPILMKLYKEYSQTKDNLSSIKKSQRETKHELAELKKNNKDIFEKHRKFHREIFQLEFAIRRGIGIGKQTCHEKLKEYKALFREFREENHLIVEKYEKIVKKIQTNHQKHNNYLAVLASYKTEIEALPILPLYVKCIAKK